MVKLSGAAGGGRVGVGWRKRADRGGSGSESARQCRYDVGAGRDRADYFLVWVV